MSTHYIHQPGTARLAALGLARAGSLRPNCPPTRPLALRRRPVRAGRRAAARATGSRAATRRAAYRPRQDRSSTPRWRPASSLRERFTGPMRSSRDGDRVAGIRGRTEGGADVAGDGARIVIGADGRALERGAQRSTRRPTPRARAQLRLLHLLGAASTRGRRALPAPRRCDRDRSTAPSAQSPARPLFRSSMPPRTWSGSRARRPPEDRRPCRCG